MSKECVCLAKHEGECSPQEMSIMDRKVYEEKFFIYNRINDVMNHLTGEILTVIDASIQSQSQNKAVKDLIKSKLYPAREGISNIIFETDNIPREFVEVEN